MPGPFGQPMSPQKRLKNVKLSSKSAFSIQELPNWSQNTNMKWLKNVKLSSKSCFSPQELQNLSQHTNMKQNNPLQLPNLTQDTNMKQLNYVKLSSQSGFSPHELPKLSQDTITSIVLLILSLHLCLWNTQVVSVLSQCCIFSVWHRSWQPLICDGVQFHVAPQPGRIFVFENMKSVPTSLEQERDLYHVANDKIG